MGRVESLTVSEKIRYLRHLFLPEVGEQGQVRLRNASVLVIGAGGLGCPALMYLCSAGVGKIGIADSDVVEASNLHRQILFTPADIGRPKAWVARDRLIALDDTTDVDAILERITDGNADRYLADFDVIVDGSDNFPTRYAVNDACVRLGKPLIHGAVHRFDGEVGLFDARKGACYRCLFPDAPPEDLTCGCSEAGVLGVLPGIVGTLQAGLALKVLLQLCTSDYGKLIIFRMLSLDFQTVEVNRKCSCLACAREPAESMKVVALAG